MKIKKYQQKRVARVGFIQKAFKLAMVLNDVENAQRFASWLSDLKLTSGNITEVPEYQDRRLTQFAIKAHEYLRSHNEA